MTHGRILKSAQLFQAKNIGFVESVHVHCLMWLALQEAAGTKAGGEMAALRASGAVTETFVYLDLEGTGLYTEPQIGHTDDQLQPQPRMTELALLAVSRLPMAAGIRDQNAPRVVHSLSLPVNPGPDAVWNPCSIQISGRNKVALSNQLLMDDP